MGIAVTAPARVLVDLAGVVGSASTRRAVERAAFLKLLDLRALDLAVQRASGRRGIPALRAILAEWQTEGDAPPDLRSDFEARALPRLVAAGLPRPECNVTLWLDGEALIVDFLWPEQRLVVETDGAGSHETPVAFQRDRRRDQLLVANGFRVLRVTWSQLRDDPGGVATRIKRALEISLRRRR
jgi:Protein of unknown function (DUF559)